jgi:hypothetical protein
MVKLTGRPAIPAIDYHPNPQPACFHPNGTIACAHVCKTSSRIEVSAHIFWFLRRCHCV